MNPGRENAFAGSRLAVDENRNVRGRDTLRPIAEKTDRRTRAAEGIDFAPSPPRVVLKAPPAIALVLEDPVDDEKKRRQLHGLDQELVRSVLNRLNRHVELFVPGQNDAGDAGVGPSHVREDVERAPVGESRGDDERIRSRRFEGLERGTAGRRRHGLVPVDVKHFLQVLARRAIRVDDQNPPPRHRRGRRTIPRLRQGGGPPIGSGVNTGPVIRDAAPLPVSSSVVSLLDTRFPLWSLVTTSSFTRPKGTESFSQRSVT